MRVVRGAGLALAAALSVGLLSACGVDSEDAQNAVATGGDFQFHSPGGQTEIFYEPGDRKKVANFSGESLMEPGKTISLDDYAGQVVVLNSWGQWCAPCRAEVDDLQQVQEALGQDGTVLGINVRDYNPAVARDFVKDNGVTYPSIYDPPFRTAAALGGVPSSVVPTTIVLDKQHRPAAVFLRAITADELIEVTEKLKAEA
ncbi:TlpA disulfide reductase family protein [Corynebacterium tapiri]|uniref:TlpA family protein disulfide reductase n=1 Tax=Corynebacterium tapiri TaxID=1448266 RepID=A0A5C4U353_9CORY|nr:TlpA disulfide reductase family protein [Corynebacterium tapiri]TNL97291.1 TlpA family protein disulfide reductase [Corynebacterium tapiri]